jgi:WD40 repeat protein
VTLGQQPNVVSGLATLYAALSDKRPSFANEEDAAFQLGQVLQDRTCLLVIDDVWESKHLRPFLRGGKDCAYLFTTRNAALASAGSSVNVDQMRAAEAVQMMTAGIVGLSVARASELSQRLGQWPIALELSAAAIRERIVLGDSVDGAATRFLKRIERKGLVGLEIGQIVGPSIELLSAGDRARFQELAIFPEDIAIPLSVAGGLWRLDEFDSEETAQRLARLSLLKLDLTQGTLRLHDVMRTWLAEILVHAVELHSRLVEGWPDWMRLPHEYAWRWLAWHLAKAGRKDDLERIVWDLEWLQAKLEATDVNALIADFEHLKPAPEADLMAGALRLSAHVLARDKSQLWSQLAGRLGPNQLPLWRWQESQPSRIVLAPLTPTLALPGQALVRTLTGHTSGVTAVAVYAEGRRAISGSKDRTLKIWDLGAGIELRSLSGHDGGVASVRAFAEGRRAISASDDGTLKIWDLATGNELSTLRGHVGQVTTVDVYASGLYAVSASADQTLKVWDLDAGNELRTLRGHTDPVVALSVCGDGRAVSGSLDQTLRVWDLDKGEEIRTLRHTRIVMAFAVYAGGRRAISVTPEGFTIWDLQTGDALRKFPSFKLAVNTIAVYADGRRAICGLWGGALKIWDPETGEELGTLTGHTGNVNAVAEYAAGKRAITAADDHTLKIWDLEAYAELPLSSRHTGVVTAIAASGKEGWAVSESSDHTLKVWDLETGRELRTLSGHTKEVEAVAVCAGGRRAISGSHDETIRVWDLETGAELRKLSNWGPVHSVAVYAGGRRAICGLSSGALQIWDLETGTVLGTLRGESFRPATDVAVYDSDRRAISASVDQFMVWDLETGTLLRRFGRPLYFATKFALYAEGRRAISNCDDNHLKIWDLETGAELRSLPGHAGTVHTVGVDDQGRRAISASQDNTVRLWDLDRGETIASFHADAPLWACAMAANRIVAGDQTGRLHFLRILGPAGGRKRQKDVSPRQGFQ